MMFFMMGRSVASGLEVLLWMAATMVVFILLALVFIGGTMFLFRWMTTSLAYQEPKQEMGSQKSPLELLKEQYVSGSITLEEFEERLPEALEKEKKLEARKAVLRQQR